MLRLDRGHGVKVFVEKLRKGSKKAVRSKKLVTLDTLINNRKGNGREGIP
jgi:hypothetical protein